MFVIIASGSVENRIVGRSAVPTVAKKGGSGLFVAASGSVEDRCISSVAVRSRQIRGRGVYFAKRF